MYYFLLVIINIRQIFLQFNIQAMATHKLQASIFCKILPVDTILILFGQWYWEVIFYFHKQNQNR